jgi:type IV secretory pathway VirB3-like protein
MRRYSHSRWVYIVSGTILYSAVALLLYGVFKLYVYSNSPEVKLAIAKQEQDCSDKHPKAGLQCFKGGRCFCIIEDKKP